METYQQIAPERFVQPALEVVSDIADLEFSESQPPEELWGFFEGGKLGHVLAGAKQLSGVSSGNRFYATHYPEIDRDNHVKPAIFHAYIVPVGDWVSTTTISIPVETGIPMVQKHSREDRHSSWAKVHNLDMAHSLIEVHRLAIMMAEPIEQTQIRT